MRARIETTREELRPLVSDRIVVTFPTDPGFRSVATLVLGGVGSRLDLPYDRMDDPQLAVLSALDMVEAPEARMEVDADDTWLRLAIGPVRVDRHEEERLRFLLSRLVDDVGQESRDGRRWLTLALSRPAAAST
jgi:hypothetical protein